MAHEQDELFDAKDNFEEVQKIMIMVVMNEWILTIFLHMQISPSTLITTNNNKIKMGSINMTNSHKK
jgi:hypothetical protein